MSKPTLSESTLKAAHIDGESKLPPWLQAYLNLKDANPEAIVLVKNGDFYETYQLIGLRPSRPPVGTEEEYPTAFLWNHRLFI